METLHGRGGAASRYGSYRTYEEWKHYQLSIINKDVGGSYRTYEEWKLATIIATIIATIVFLPYL